MAEIAELDLPHLAMEQDWFAADTALHDPTVAE